MPELNLEQQRNATVGSPVTLEIPISMNKKGARKFIKAPNGTDIVSTRLPKYDDTLIKAVIRAHDWQGRIESGLVASVAELALKEGIGENYVGKIIRLTELAPDITMAILNGRQPPSMTLSQMEDVPLLWEEQRQAFGFAGQ